MHFAPRLLNILSATSLVSGVGLFASRTVFQADLTGQGSTILETGLHQAAGDIPAIAPADAGVQLMSGILLILVAFFLHALAKSRNGERSVHITVKPKKKQKTWFWIEMKI